MAELEPVRAELIRGFLENVDRAIGTCVDDLIDRGWLHKSREITAKIEFVPDEKAKPGEISCPTILIGVSVKLPSDKTGGMGAQLKNGQLLVDPQDWFDRNEDPHQMHLDNVTEFKKEASEKADV